MTLVDTSVWIEFLRGTQSPHHLWLRRQIKDGANLAWAEPVLVELANGRGEDLTNVQRMLLGATLLSVEHDDWIRAAELLRATRSGGTTVRSTNDALLAAVALRADVPLIARDRDFPLLAQVSDLQLAAPTASGGA